MNPTQTAVVKYLADSLPYLGLLILGYFVLFGSDIQGRSPRLTGRAISRWRCSRLSHALTISSYYQYLNLPRLPLPATTLSTGQVFVITALGLFLSLAATNVAARLLAAILGFGAKTERSSTGRMVSMAAVTKKPSGNGEA